MIARHQDWQSRLDGFIRSKRPAQPEWGSTDCFLFACDAVLAMTGTDIAARFRGQYSTPLGALKVMQEFAIDAGLAGGVDKLGQEFGFGPVGVKFAGTGDVLLFPPPDEANPFKGLLGVSIGRQAAVISERGLAALPTLSAIRAWHIPI